MKLVCTESINVADGYASWKRHIFGVAVDVANRRRSFDDQN